jgi:serine/threonine-protein kinase RsbW
VETVSITIPASPEYVKIVRLVAAGLAARVGFTIEDIDDLKIAVDELSSYLTGTQGREGTIQVRFSVHDDRIEISGSGRFSPGQKIRSELTEFSRVILETVADEASLEHLNGVPTFRVAKGRK